MVSKGRIQYLGDANNHVPDVRDNSAHSRSMARGAPPDLGDDLVTDLLDINLEVPEGPLERTTGAGDRDLAAVHGHGD